MDFQKYDIKEKKKKEKTKSQELLKNNNHKKIYMAFALKIGYFFKLFIFKSSITPLILTFITYYYFAKKREKPYF